jgi:VWFA-related protein
VVRRYRRAGAFVCVAAVAVLARVAALGGTQAQSPQVPAFKSGVELIAVDVSVVDKAGNPIRSLQSDQFDVRIDGQPRRVVSAEFIDHVPAAGLRSAGATKDVPRPAYSSNDAPGVPAAPGRLMFIAVDQGSFRPAGARGATEAARRFIDRLQPQDRIGLLTFPAPGRALAASKNHAAVRDALSFIVGVGESLTSTVARAFLSLGEAIDIEAGDEAAFARVSSRECSLLTANELKACQDNIRADAHYTGIRAETQARGTLNGLRSIVAGLAAVQERKTLVLISGGLPVADRFGGGLDSRAEIASIATEAAVTNTNIYILYVDSTFREAFSVSQSSPNETLTRDAAMVGAGLETMAGASGGTLFRVEAGADTAFDRVLRETAASYVVGVEAAAADRNGRPHPIVVSVKMPGVQVRHRREFVAPAPAAAADKPASLLTDAMRNPRLATALPVGVSTRTLGRADSGTLRVLIAANVGRGLTEPIEAQIGYAVTDAAGRIVGGDSVEKRPLSVSRSSDARSAPFVSVVGLKPGDYNLRLAAVDASGRVGSVDHAFSAALSDGDGISMSDLLLLDPTRARDETLAPLADGKVRGQAIGAHLEVYGRASQPSTATVSFGIADRADGEMLVSQRASVSKTDPAGHVTAAASLDLSALPPGDYVAVAVVSDGKRQLGRRIQPLRIEAAAPPVGNGGGDASPIPSVRFAMDASSNVVRSFARTDVLAPDALRFFAGRLTAAEKGPAPAGVEAATAAVRGGQFDEALAALADSASDRLSVVFLRGLALLGKGELEPAAGQFRDALRIADDFLPAAFYLGACYAAGGRDSEAVGAWQMALITETDARIVYEVLIDALLRQGEAGQALEALTEARGRWPGDGRFTPRLAAAQVMLDRQAEALATLEDHLQRQPSDAEATALAIRLIYQAHAAGRVAKTAAADRELAAKYRELYRAAGGANQALVDRWVAFILKS